MKHCLFVIAEGHHNTKTTVTARTMELTDCISAFRGFGNKKQQAQAKQLNKKRDIRRDYK
jgi:hypothetical protein